MFYREEKRPLIVKSSIMKEQTDKSTIRVILFQTFKMDF